MANITSQQMETTLFLEEVRAKSLEMGRDIKNGMDLSDEQKAVLDELVQRHIEGIDADKCFAQALQAKPKRGKVTDGTRTRKKPDAADQCQARIWGDGSGHNRCSFKCVDGDFCKKHGKQAVVTSEPCQNDEGGGKIGLHFGRYDSWQDGEDGVMPYKDSHGVIRIEWNSDEMKARVQGDLDADIATRAPGSKSGKVGRKKKVAEDALAAEATSAQELQAALDEESTVVDEMPVVNEPVTELVEVSTAVDEMPVVNEPVTELVEVSTVVDEVPAVTEAPVQVKSFDEADLNGDGLVDKDEWDKAHEISTSEPETNGDLENMEDEEMEVVEKEWKGETYLINEKTNQIIDEEEVIPIGTWDDATGPTFD